MCVCIDVWSHDRVCTEKKEGKSTQTSRNTVENSGTSGWYQLLAVASRKILSLTFVNLDQENNLDFNSHEVMLYRTCIHTLLNGYNKHEERNTAQATGKTQIQ